MYLSIKPDENNPTGKLEAFVKDIRHCMMVNYLLLNPGKTEVIIVGSRNQRDTLSDQIVALDCVSVASSSTVRNLGVIFVQDLSFKAQIIKLVKLPFFFICATSAKIRNILSKSDAEKLIHAFVTSRLDQMPT